METQRQKKVSNLLLKDLSTIVQSFFREKRRVNLIVSVTKVKISVDLSLAKIYVSVFPSENIKNTLELLQNNKYDIKKKLSLLVKNQLRIVPEIQFFIDEEMYFEYPMQAQHSPFDKPFFLLLNLAVGGHWTDGYVAPGFTEATYEIDYVRVYQ